MKLKTILAFLLPCLILFACQEDENPTTGQTPGNGDDKNGDDQKKVYVGRIPRRFKLFLQLWFKVNIQERLSA